MLAAATAPSLAENDPSPAEFPPKETAGAAAAGEEPAAPGNRLASELDAALRRAENHRADLPAVRAGIERRREEERALHAAGSESILKIAGRLEGAEAGSPAAGALYGAIVDELQEARPRLREALDALKADSEVPVWSTDLDPAVRSAAGLAERVRRLDAFPGEFAEEEGRLRGLEASVRWEAVDLRGTVVERLNALRIDCLRKLGAAERRDILGLSEAGVAQLAREVEQISLSARLYAVRRERDVRGLPGRMRSIFRVGAATYVGIELIGILIAYLWLRRRWSSLLERARRLVFPRVGGVRGKRAVETLVGALEVVGPWTLFLIALHLVRRALGPAAALPEVGVPLHLAGVYGAYRLAIDASYAVLVVAARRYRLHLTEALRAKLFTGVRGVARLVAAIAILLQVSSRFLGEGALYHLVARLAWILAAIIVFRLVAGWRQEICHSYLTLIPTGALAEAVRRTRDNWYGLFVAAASFVLLAGRAAAVLARDFALGFNQTRKALAFLFRRKVEKHAEQLGYAEARPESLPGALVEAFSQEETAGDKLLLNYFPGMERLSRSLEAWRAGRGGGSFLLTGDTGIGKSTWLARLRTDGMEVARLGLSDRPDTPQSLARILGAGIFPHHPPPPSPSALAEALGSGPPRVIILDVAQNLFLQAPGGYGCFEEFVNLVESTSRRVFWICACNAFAWVHLAAVRPDLAVFRHRHDLGAWSEDQIRALLRARLAASGVRATYEDLVLDRMEGVSAEATLLQTEEGFARLLWDYADGNPRVALNCWLRSVVPDAPDRVRVRLFRAPDPEELERGGEEGLFVLAAIVNHENLTLEEAVRVTSFPEVLCRIHLDRCTEIGALHSEGGRHRVTTRWQRPVIRLLRRRNLLPD